MILWKEISSLHERFREMFHILKRLLRGRSNESVGIPKGTRILYTDFCSKLDTAHEKQVALLSGYETIRVFHKYTTLAITPILASEVLYLFLNVIQFYDKLSTPAGKCAMTLKQHVQRLHCLRTQY